MTDLYGNISISPDGSPGKSPEPPADKKEKPPRKTRKTKRRVARKTPRKVTYTIATVLCLLLLAGGYLFAGYWFVPKFVRDLVIDTVQRQSGRIPYLGQVHFDPFRFQLSLEDLSITASDEDGRPILQTRTVTAKVQPLPLLRKELIFTSFEVDELALYLIRHSDGTFNYQKFFNQDTGQQADEIFDFAELPFLFSINNIKISNGGIVLEDRLARTSHTVEQMFVTLPSLSNTSFSAEEYLEPKFSAVINGSQVELTGRAMLDDTQGDTGNNTTQLECAVKDLDLSLYGGYLPFLSPVTLNKGVGNGTLGITFSRGGADGSLVIDFDLQADGVEAIGKQSPFKLNIPTLATKGALFPFAKSMRIGEVTVRDPQLTLPQSADNATQSDKISTEPFNYTVEVSKGFIDNGALVRVSKDGKPATEWDSLQLRINNYGTSGSQANGGSGSFQFSGQRAGTKTSLNWRGKFGEKNSPEGEIKLINYPVSDLFHQLNLPAKGTGNLDAEGFLRLVRSSDSLEFTPYLEGVSLNFSQAEFVHKGSSWLSASSAKITGLAKKGEAVSLGNIQVRGGKAQVNIKNLPPILRLPATPKGLATVDRLDFSGSIEVSGIADTGSALAFQNVSLNAINLSSPKKAESRNNFSFTGNLGKTGEIQAKGKVQLKPLTASLTTRFDKVEAKNLLPLFTSNTILKAVEGSMNGSGELTFPDVSYSGELSLLDGQYTTSEETKTSWKSIIVDNLRYSRTPLHLGADDIFIDTPVMTYSMDETSPHLAHDLTLFLEKNTPSKHNDPRKTTIIPALSFENVRLANGSVSYSDQRFLPSWSADISALQGVIQNFSSSPQAAPSLFRFTGTLDSVPFQLNGAHSFFNSKGKGRATFEILDYPLASFYQQLSESANIDASRGTGSTSYSSEWQDEQISSNVSLNFSNVQPSDPESMTALTLALLSNQQDAFSLNLSSQKNFSDNSESLVNEAVSTFNRMVIKASISPLLLATGDFSDLIDNEHVEFRPGQVELTGNGRETLTGFSRLLSMHPRLHLRLSGSADPEIDGLAMKQELEMVEKDRVEKENRERAEQLERAIQEYLDTTSQATDPNDPANGISEQEIPPEIYQRFAPVTPVEVEIDSAMLKELADQRANLIAELFIDKLALDPERITVEDSVVVEKNDSGAGNRVNFSLNAQDGTDVFSTPSNNL